MYNKSPHITQKQNMYKALISNNYSAEPSTANAFVGGLSLDNNIYNFPESVVEMLKMATQEDPENEEKRVLIRLEVTLELTKEQVMQSELLSRFFEKSFWAKIPQRFIGSDPRDQRPAVTASELFEPLAALAAQWEPNDFVMTQMGESPICHVGVTLSGMAADMVIALIGY